MTVKQCPVCGTHLSGNGETQAMLFFELHVRAKHPVDNEDES